MYNVIVLKSGYVQSGQNTPSGEVSLFFFSLAILPYRLRLVVILTAVPILCRFEYTNQITPTHYSITLTMKSFAHSQFSSITASMPLSPMLLPPPRLFVLLVSWVTAARITWRGYLRESTAVAPAVLTRPVEGICSTIEVGIGYSISSCTHETFVRNPFLPLPLLWSCHHINANAKPNNKA